MIARASILRAGAAALAGLFLIAAPAQAASVVLRGLDKTTGVAKDFVAPIGKKVRFHTLEVLARACVKHPPEETPEAAAYLEIFDTPVADADKEAGPQHEIFSGWMYWSSPALNPLEHPSYDIWVIDCKS
jgi:hypothetical protein